MTLTCVRVPREDLHCTASGDVGRSRESDRDAATGEDPR